MSGKSESGGTQKELVDSYRSITVTSALCSHVIWLRLQRWAEEQVLGDLQNGFRTSHCLEDNLFVVTQVMESAAKEGRRLFVGLPRHYYGG